MPQPQSLNNAHVLIAILTVLAFVGTLFWSFLAQTDRGMWPVTILASACVLALGYSTRNV